ncbi:SDR family oxidoreductase [Roseibium sp. CAU 1637]|uniref:SDR family oxidoreductase n=2 Tax=Roseibium limicola TaxID=2816037 RepID=A0A939ERE6_9HYPH|nr:SDR family oxidoreductase [Roseibium limicola]
MAVAKRTVLITGCSSGIGLNAARLLRGRDWRVFATARKQQDVDELAAQGFEAFRLDYEEPESLKTVLMAVLERTDGRLDALFNNGAYAIPGALEDISPEALQTLFQANFFGWHELTRLVVPVMRAQGSGRIVQCSSILGFIAMPFRGAYTASKFALEGYTDTLRMELAGTGIHVSLIEPGPIDTAFTANALDNFDRWIGDEGMQSSVHLSAYKKRRKRMEAGEPGPFKLPATAVVKQLLHALEAKKPKARYYVTIPTHLLGGLKRLLPTALLDRFLLRAAKSEE